ncbi:MAG: uL15 family ribosomal protein [Patescibacteria group bacterium]
MQLHQVQRATARKFPKMVGRGSKRGKTSGRGTKGQNARAGRKKYPEIRDMIKRIPKMRGRGKNSNLTIEVKPTVITLEMIEKAFQNGEAVNPKTLIEKKVLETLAGRIPKVKLLATGTLTKKLTISGCAYSAGVTAIVEKAGGTIK